jgi:hypothetical protein
MVATTSDKFFGRPRGQGMLSQISESTGEAVAYLIRTGCDYRPVGADNSSLQRELHTYGNRDRDRINVHEEYELRYWTKELGVTLEKLTQTVEKVGVMVTDVRGTGILLDSFLSPCKDLHYANSPQYPHSPRAV